MPQSFSGSNRRARCAQPSIGVAGIDIEGGSSRLIYGASIAVMAED